MLGSKQPGKKSMLRWAPSLKGYVNVHAFSFKTDEKSHVQTESKKSNELENTITSAA
jgi:hypothetical protein